MNYVKLYEEFINESNSDEVEMILSKDQDFDDVKKLLRTDKKASNLDFTHWTSGQPLGSIRGHLITMFFSNTKDEVTSFIQRNNIKIANKSNFNLDERFINEEAAYTVTKNTYRDYDNLNITSYDSIQFKQDGNKWIVRVVTAHDNIDTAALRKLGFTNQGATRYTGISTFTKNANWHDLELTKKQFDQLVKIVDAGWASHAKAFADFYRDREAD